MNWRSPSACLAGIEGRVLAVEAALHIIADNQGTPTGTVVGAGTVVPYPTTEFGEYEHGDVVAQVVLVQVVEEVLDVIGHVAPQRSVEREGAAVQVETVVRRGGVEGCGCPRHR